MKRAQFIEAGTGKELFVVETARAFEKEGTEALKQLVERLGLRGGFIFTEKQEDGVEEKLNELIKVVERIALALECKALPAIDVAKITPDVGKLARATKELKEMNDAARRTCDFEATAAGGEK